MHTLFVTALLLALPLNYSSASARTFTQARQSALHLVRKIYIGELGPSDQAARFRLLLEDELSERGFIVTSKPDEADAILSGALSETSGGIYGGVADVSLTVRLVSADGVRLWSINLPRPVTFSSTLKTGSLKIKEVVEYRAEEVAKGLRSDWVKSARAAGIKVSK